MLGSSSQGQERNMRIELVERIEPTSGFQQQVFRAVHDGERDWILTLALSLPQRQAGDSKSVSEKQRETLAAFFWGADHLPDEFGWQQASQLMNMRGLAYAVAETMNDGFLAANRMEIAPLIAAYISQSAYHSALARAWNLGGGQNYSDRDPSDWLILVASPFYRELLEFGILAREDLGNLTSGAV